MEAEDKSMDSLSEASYQVLLSITFLSLNILLSKDGAMQGGKMEVRLRQVSLVEVRVSRNNAPLLLDAWNKLMCEEDE